jgi:hypothetical protein
VALKELGRIIGETSHYRIVFTANRPPRVGEYVVVEYPEAEVDGVKARYVLAMVESSTVGNPVLLVRGITPEYVERASELNLERSEYSIGSARLIGWLELLEQGRLYTPKYPPKPGAPVYEAESAVLRRIFDRKGQREWIRVGRLVNHPDVPVYVNVNTIVSRHLAILAITGAGKSNTVGVLVDQIVNKLKGTVLLVDMHNEYVQVAGENTNEVAAKIHPVKLTVYEYYRLLNLDEKATKQRMYLRKALRELLESGEASKQADKFLDLLEEKLAKYSEDNSRDRNSIIDLLNKIEELRARYENRVLAIDAPTSLEQVIVPGKANVLKLGSVDEEVADVVVYHYLDWLLRERKNYFAGREGYPVPVLVVIEEAHVLIPRNRSTLTKLAAARIAREGRKFGTGLCLVSQRPKNVDEDALSQTNNKIILKLVEPSDQRYVQQASEMLSEELLELLPSLNTGEAILLGIMIPIPALVKIDRAKHKVTGGDLDIAGEWLRYAEDMRKAEEEAVKYDPYTMF